MRLSNRCRRMVYPLETLLSLLKPAAVSWIARGCVSRYKHTHTLTCVALLSCSLAPFSLSGSPRMTGKAELLPFSAGGNRNVSKCQAAGAFGLAFRLIRHTYSQQRLGLLARSSICWKPKHETVREHVMSENKPANKCDRSGGKKKGCVSSVRATSRRRFSASRAA